MTLDHDTGAVSGEVSRGRFQGRRLDQLSRAQVFDLLDEIDAGDPQSTQLIESFLDRTHGGDWRDHYRGRARGAAGGAGAMTREEALEVLGLGEGAGPDEIKEAHRALIQKIHPDHGGSDYLAAKINQAKDVLLGN